MRRRRTRVLSAHGVLVFGLVPGFLALGLVTLSRFVIVAGACAVSHGFCP